MEFEIKDGKGNNIKEYHNDELIFEGEYLNGKKWNGNGKEYSFYGELIFEGEYLKGQRNGTYFGIYKYIGLVQFNNYKYGICKK